MRSVVAELKFIRHWAATLVATLCTVPAVGGYSNAPTGSDFTTVGIVTQVEGDAFAAASGKSAGEAVGVGQGVLNGDRLWVDSHSLVRVADTVGGRITIAGPASVEFVKTGKLHDVVRIARGSVKFHSAEGKVMFFENPFVAGSVAGEGAVWASGDLVQIAGLSGDVKAWHPHLASAQILVTPGFFTESSMKFRHLQPKRPERVDADLFSDFLARFEESALGETRALASSEHHSPTRSKASVPDAFERGSRTIADVTEPRSADAAQWLKSHISGKDVGEPDPIPLAKLKAAAHPQQGPLKYDAFGQPIRPRFEVVKEREN